MNLASIFSAFIGLERRTVAVARSTILLVRQAYAHLPGDVQHSKAVGKLVEAFPNMEKWAAHALIGATFGWLKKHSPEKLLPIEGLIEADLTTAADQAIDRLSQPSPFAPDATEENGRALLRRGPISEADPPTPSTPDASTTTSPPSLPVSQSSPPGLGESPPPPAAQPQPMQPMIPGIQPLAPTGTPPAPGGNASPVT